MTEHWRITMDEQRPTYILALRAQALDEVQDYASVASAVVPWARSKPAESHPLGDNSLERAYRRVRSQIQSRSRSRIHAVASPR
jgi:hypothetical protein